MLSNFRLPTGVAVLCVAGSVGVARLDAQSAAESLISPKLQDAELVQFATGDARFAAAALGLVQGRVCAYAEAAETEFGQEVVTHVRTSRVYIPPRTGALGNALASGKLYLEYSKAAAAAKVQLPESWDEVGFLVLERISSVLHHYFLAVEYRGGQEKDLERLREYARELSTRLAGVEPLSDRLPGLVARAGALWFEKCEEVLPLYEKLLGSPAFASARENLFFRPNGVPLVTAWTWQERKRADDVQREFIKTLIESEQAGIKIDGLVLAAALERGDRRFAEAYTRFVEAVQTSDARAAYGPVALQLLEDRRFRTLSEKTRDDLRGLYQARFGAETVPAASQPVQGEAQPEAAPAVAAVPEKKADAKEAALPRPKEMVGWQALATPGERLYWETMPLIELRALAADRDVVANYYVFLKLRGTEGSLAEAERALAFASKAGFPQAQLEQAKRLPDAEEKFALTAQAAASMYPAAQLALGELLIAGEGTLSDCERGLVLVRTAYDLKTPEAQVTLAQLYASGIGEPRNPAETAANLFLGAAKADLPGAMVELHHRYLEGYHSVRDQLEASRWLVNAAMHDRAHLAKYVDEAGKARPQLTGEMDQFAGRLATYAQAVMYKNPEAMKQVAEWYEKGSIGRKSKIRAYALFSLANSSGAAAPEEVVRLKAKLSAQELKTAEMLAAQWKQIRPDVL